MVCKECGNRVPRGAVICLNCGVPLPGTSPMPGATQAPAPTPPVASAPATAQGAAKTPNYLAGAILVTFCCCMPPGIVAMIYAVQVNSKLGVGDVQGAAAASKKAKAWLLWGIALGIVANVCFLIFAAMTDMPEPPVAP